MIATGGYGSSLIATQGYGSSGGGVIDKPGGGGSGEYDNLWLQKQEEQEFFEIICMITPIIG